MHSDGSLSARRRTLALWPKWTALVVGGLIVLLLIIAAVIDSIDLTGPIERAASHAAGRGVHVQGGATVDLFALRPRLTVRGLQIDNPPWVQQEEHGPPMLATIPRLVLSVRLPALLTGRIVLRLVEMDQPTFFLVRQKSGRNNYTLTGGPQASQKAPAQKSVAQQQPENKPEQLPGLQGLLINDGRIQVIDHARRLYFDGTMQSAQESAKAAGESFRLRGSGSLNDRRFRLTLSGGSLQSVNPNQPYPFRTVIEAGPISGEAQGTLLHPFNLGEMDVRMKIRGADLADLYELTGLALPNTPAYQISLNLRRQGNTLDLTEFKGTIGSSDVQGDFTIDAGKYRPLMTASLRSENLDVRDLGAVIGGIPGQKTREGGLLLPDTPLDLQRVQSMDARLHYTADMLRLSPSMQLKHAAFTLTLDKGLLTLDPLKVTLPQGDLAGRIDIDARAYPPSTRIDLTLQDARLQNLVPAVGGQPTLQGMLQAKLKLTGAGVSLHRAAAHADGELVVVVPHGEIRRAFADLLGVDVARALSLLMTGDQQKTDLRCALIRFDAQRGNVVTQAFVIDTAAVQITGSGHANLGNEALDLTIQGKPTHPSLRIRAPIAIRGTLAHPTVAPQPGPLALGTLLTPITSLLTFVDPALANNPNCQASVKQGEQHIRSASQPTGARISQAER